jgi:uncharacterized cofD-like protein
MHKKTKIVTIGGGTGMPVINEALVLGGFTKIKSIVSTFDSGGDTGRIRTDERGQILANSDYWRSLISLWDDGEQKAIWENMLRYRDGRGRNFGNTFFQFMSEKVDGLSNVGELFKKLTMANIVGEVIPVSLKPAEVCFKTTSGKEYKGERYLDELRMSRDFVTKLWLEPEVEANPKAVEALKEADLIIVCPGSVHGSLLTNFLAGGVTEAFAKSKAKKLLMVNIMASGNEGIIKNQNDYLDLFTKSIKSSFDLVLMTDLNRLVEKKLSRVIEYYEMENSSQIKYLPGSKCKCEVADIATIDEVNWRLRHSKDKLAKYFVKMDLCHRRD